MILSNYREGWHNFEIFKSGHKIPPFFKRTKKEERYFRGAQNDDS